MAQDNQTKIWELLAKKNAGEASEEDVQALSELLRNTADLPAIESTDVLQRYWEKLYALPDAELQQTAAIYWENNFENKVIYRQNFFTKNWWKIAAAIVIAVGIGALFSIFSKPQIIEVATGKAEHKEFLLPDGTKVQLNEDSKLYYPADYLQSASRDVTLVGEAYFDVKHDAEHRFVIHTKFGINIQDAGTIFNVKAYPDDKTLETTLIKGAIEVFDTKTPQNKLLLRPNEKFIFYQKQKFNAGHTATTPAAAVSAGTIANCNFEISKIVPMINNGDSLFSETAWTKNELAFNTETFSELTDKMNRWYNTKIVINDTAVANYRFTGVFDKESLTQALDELKMIRPFNYSIENNTVTIFR